MESNLLENASLRYCMDNISGYRRERKGKGFSYRDKKGNIIKDPRQLDRIRTLIIPPAWTRVWISPYANGHLQVTGYDERGRKQYIYHQEWNRIRSEDKFRRMRSFGERLPFLRKQIKKDLRRPKVDQRKAVAIALEVMEETLIRAGNSYYREANDSYGLTTLYNRQIKLKKGVAVFDFRGKKGVSHHIEVSNARLVRHLAKIMEIPGQEVFSYYDADGGIYPVGSGDLNAYIQEFAGNGYTTKDFRTWSGTVWAFRYLASLDDFDSGSACKQNINACLDHVAKKLGNTRAVCRNYYVHKAMLEAYADGNLRPFLRLYNRKGGSLSEAEKAERQMLRFLGTIEMIEG